MSLAFRNDLAIILDLETEKFENVETQDKINDSYKQSVVDNS